MSITDIMRAFRAALVAVAPIAQSVGVRWQEWENYDDWDRIEEALFRSMVSQPLEFILGEGRVFGLPIIGNVCFNPDSDSLLFEETVGPDYRFFKIGKTFAPFDTVMLMSVTGREGEDVIEREFKQCQFVASLLCRSDGARHMVRLGCVGQPE